MIFTLRRAGREDIPALAALVGETIARINCRDYTPAQIGVWAERASSLVRWEELFGSGLVFFVAETPDGKPVGVSSVRADGYLHTLYSHYLFQNCGIASQLLEVSRDCVRRGGGMKIYSEVSKTALPFFLRRGFSCVEKQTVAVNGIEMENYRMECPI